MGPFCLLACPWIGSIGVRPKIDNLSKGVVSEWGDVGRAGVNNTASGTQRGVDNAKLIPPTTSTHQQTRYWECTRYAYLWVNDVVYTEPRKESQYYYLRDAIYAKAGDTNSMDLTWVHTLSISMYINTELAFLPDRKCVVRYAMPILPVAILGTDIVVIMRWKY